MIASNKPRGLQAIRSMSGLVTETSHPHRKFLKLAILAMEHARREKERVSASNRIEIIDVRLAEIDTESKYLLQVCSAIEISKRSDSQELQKIDISYPPIKGEFKIKY